MEGDYPLGAKDDSSAPYNQLEYTRNVIILLEGDITIESSVPLSSDEIDEKIKAFVESEIDANCINYSITDITVNNI